MDEKVRRQIEKIMENAEAKDLERTRKFFRQVQSVGLPAEEDRSWLTKQFQIYLEALTLSKGEEEAARLWPFVLFTMGRAYELNHTSLKAASLSSSILTKRSPSSSNSHTLVKPTFS